MHHTYLIKQAIGRIPVPGASTGALYNAGAGALGFGALGALLGGVKGLVAPREGEGRFEGALNEALGIGLTGATLGGIGSGVAKVLQNRGHRQAVKDLIDKARVQSRAHRRIAADGGFPRDPKILDPFRQDIRSLRQGAAKAITE